jgi:hypothetical protein
MIQLKPSLDNIFICPECQAEKPFVHDVLFLSMHVMADCTCRHCNFQFLQTLPVGHNESHVISVGKGNHKVYEPTAESSWMASTFLPLTDQTGEIKVRKIVYRECREVIVLNTLDFLYGHTLLKLYNALHHLDRDQQFGLVVIVPSSFEWLIPDGCAEAWIVDCKLSRFRQLNEHLASFVSNELRRFDKVLLSPAHSHPDVANVDISRLTRIKPFDISRWSDASPTITFVLREDRWWFGYRLDYWIYRIARRLRFPPVLVRALAARQNNLVRKAIHGLKKKIPGVRIIVTGLGNTGTFEKMATDLRRSIIDRSVEIGWCKTYAQSHLVIGLHGSNMLLPTALAAGALEILPEDRFGNIGQDISVRYQDRRQLFLYRFLEQYAHPDRVATIAAAMIRDFPTFQRNMCDNTYNNVEKSVTGTTTVPNEHEEYHAAASVISPNLGSEQNK